MAVTFTYNGSNQLQAVCTGLIAGDTYQLNVNDPDSTPVNGVADGSGDVTLTVTDIGGVAAPQRVDAWVWNGGTPVEDYTAVTTLLAGTAAVSQWITGVTFAYDGASNISVTFPTNPGTNYEFFTSCASTAQFFVGDGTTQTQTIPDVTPGAAPSFRAGIVDEDITSFLRTLIFVTGAAGAGVTSRTGGGSVGGGRVLIAFDDGPLVANPAWTAIDQAGDFPDQFVSGYDTSNGRQTLISQTDTGTATVYINDHVNGLFDPRNSGSPYFGKLDGRQIMLQLLNPVTAVWEQQFQGWIDDVTYDPDATGVNAAGEPVNVGIQLQCVDMFDFLNGFGLTPGLAGVAPPTGGEDGVWYAEQHVDDRLIEILTDVGVDSTRYGSPSLASGNVNVVAVKYDPDSSALTAIRDAMDGEIPFIANGYVDRFGKFQFRGRYGRFDPDDVSAEMGSTWDFTRWAVGDGAAIVADSSRAQMRALACHRGRSDTINVAVSYPQGIKPADMPDQVYADPTSITAYGQHAAPPMSDLLTSDTSLTSGAPNAKVECFHFAKLLVLNQKDPREAISRLQVKTVHPDDPRAAATWAFLTRSDISHIVNVAVGYPAGTGFTGSSPDDDYYIEGRSLVVRALEPGFDYVELNVEVSPAVWSMDTHGVFPPFS
jgi:hypothetical protein